jgi:hypothetical protein
MEFELPYVSAEKIDLKKLKNAVIMYKDFYKQNVVSVNYGFTRGDNLKITYHEDWVEDTRYEFHHNGVKIQEDRALELVG